MSEPAVGAAIRGQIIPTLPMRDVEQTLSYFQRLGFEVVAEYPGEQRYAIVRRDDAELHFYEFPVDPRQNLSGCYLRIQDAPALYDEWRATGIEILQELTKTDYGLHEFAIADPSGNLLKVGSPLASEDGQ